MQNRPNNASKPKLAIITLIWYSWCCCCCCCCCRFVVVVVGGCYCSVGGATKKQCEHAFFRPETEVFACRIQQGLSQRKKQPPVGCRKTRPPRSRSRSGRTALLYRYSPAKPIQSLTLWSANCIEGSSSERTARRLRERRT